MTVFDAHPRPLALPSSRMGSQETDYTPLVYAVIGMTMFAVLVADLLTPLGIAIWIVYLIPVALSLWVCRVEVPLCTAAAASAFILITLNTDAPGFDRSIALINRGLGLFAIWTMGGIGYFFIRNKLAVRREEWLKSGQTGLSEAVRGDLRSEQLAENVLGFLANYADAQAGAFFIRYGSIFRRMATYGVPADDAVVSQFDMTESLLGQAAKDRRLHVIRHAPEGYLTVGSALGRGTPRHLVIKAVDVDDHVNAVFELGFLHPISENLPTLLERLSPAIGVAVRSAEYRTNLQNLLEETQRQAEELQAQSEELRVTNEELEEQGRALKESQTRLELQQTELEQTNMQLEEQTQLLETQRDDLQKAQSTLQSKAREIELASRYKSDFLANMSHELRTPLNSSLILAKLLADNPQGNLSDEQVRFAQTILASGNDLLTLINDILDLSKIEAGKMEVRPERISLSHLVSDLRRTFEPLAEQKGLTLRTEMPSDCPTTISTDRQRLDQILKNLLSNAVKFTDAGSVTLDIRPADAERMAFAVTDTGIGISSDQQAAIFEAFHQADSTASRRHGGTGLGLSIARELTRLLGGEIRVASEPGRGSTFTILIPMQYQERLIVPRPQPTAAPPPARELSAGAEVFPTSKRKEVSKPASFQRHLDDDRSRLQQGKSILLVVEDDETFARILYDLAHELNFQCLIATTAEEAQAIAIQYMPSAVILDVLLPDHSGLSVLDRLKHDSRTRHIPVHVVSAGDFTETALSLGAVGYLVKPVSREALMRALQGLESRLTQEVKRVLVVEDDQIQLDSVRKLLASVGVETEGAASAAECVEKLQQETFDCMVLDLSLPDSSGYSLLETLSSEDAYSFPPVIVYTGKDLSADEEQRLRKYSKSIIIKGAKSPERLLDEVTLFLHQVVSDLPAQQQRMLEKARSRDAMLEGRRILIVEDDVRNVFALTSIFESRGALVQIARNGRESLTALEASRNADDRRIDLVLMDVMMPEMDGLTATREIRQRPEWRKLPIIMLTAKAMKDDQENCIAAGANDYMAKPLDVDKLLSLVRVWMPR